MSFMILSGKELFGYGNTGDFRADDSDKVNLVFDLMSHNKKLTLLNAKKEGCEKTIKCNIHNAVCSGSFAAMSYYSGISENSPLAFKLASAYTLFSSCEAYRAFAYCKKIEEKIHRTGKSRENIIKALENIFGTDLTAKFNELTFENSEEWESVFEDAELASFDLQPRIIYYQVNVYPL